MSTLSYKEFIEKVSAHLHSISYEELTSIILSWASETHPSNRQDFLFKLTPTAQRKKPRVNAVSLMEEIDAFEKRVSNGEYATGWGWDDAFQDERDFGDESWAEEMDEFLLQARSLLLQGESDSAEEAYTLLFDILQMGQDPGHLPGDPDFRRMLTVDLKEHVALFLRSVYLNCDFEERPKSLYEGMNECGNLAGKVRLSDIINSFDTLLLDFDDFLDRWIDFLKVESDTDVSELLREAVLIKGGIPAIAEFARKYANKYPKAYLDWIAAIEVSGDTESVIRIAREGLCNIDRDFVVRAKVAEAISRIGQKLNNNDLKLEGFAESFYSNPSMGYLLDLYVTALDYGKFEEIRDKTEKRISDLLSNKKTQASCYHNSEMLESSVSDSVLFNSQLLAGKYKEVFEKCKDIGSLGWSSGGNPKSLFINFMMTLLSKKGIYSRVLVKQWEKAIGNTSLYSTNEYVEKYKKIACEVMKSLQLNEEHEEFFLKWCIEEVGSRIDAIVSNKHRGSYDKAAGLLVAMAETLANRDEKQKGRDFIEKYKIKYSRHIAFRSEVTKAMQTSGLFVETSNRKGSQARQIYLTEEIEY